MSKGDAWTWTFGLSQCSVIRTQIESTRYRLKLMLDNEEIFDRKDLRVLLRLMSLHLGRLEDRLDELVWDLEHPEQSEARMLARDEMLLAKSQAKIRTSKMVGMEALSEEP